MENVVGEQGLAVQQLFPYKSYFIQNLDRHKISCFNDGGLKFGHFWYFRHAFFKLHSPFNLHPH